MKTLMDQRDEEIDEARAEITALKTVLEEINMIACYASEEDIDSQPKALLMIGEKARAALAEASNGER